MYDFDWLQNKSVVANLAISAIVFAAFGCFIAWVTGPDNMPLKAILGGGIVPVITSVTERLRKSPKTMDIEERLREGERVDRRIR